MQAHEAHDTAYCKPRQSWLIHSDFALIYIYYIYILQSMYVYYIIMHIYLYYRYIYILHMLQATDSQCAANRSALDKYYTELAFAALTATHNGNKICYEIELRQLERHMCDSYGYNFTASCGCIM